MINTNNASLNSLGLNNTNTHYIKREISVQNTIAAKQNEENIQEADSFEQKRQTYGLAILELMSDQEYQAWMRATAGMTETEKMLAVQKLYPLADIERLKKSKMEFHPQEAQSLNIDTQNSHANISLDPYIINANKLNGMKVFNANSDFVQRYRNAFENLDIGVSMNG
ncbi:hypothetical protein CQA53_04085 [Helicobacter didelphidarum]|uniref:Uncharacterized protein n=1 Tax=Helicobacter didelphidarum TaxID=2040648 RepID=A0A3D8IMD1_9HELI|nr:hypothetical protein [Helicobacter didelphidarum]RDU66399.1 hypothetical protein CQA53_04085 [Helicobacter didelphidarum]